MYSSSTSGDAGSSSTMRTRRRYSLARCGWRAARRSRERWDFWWWVLTYRRTSLPAILRTPTTATRHVFRNPGQTEAFLATLRSGQ